MNRTIAAICFSALFIAQPAIAQQQADAATMQRIIVVLQAQRNQAMDAAAGEKVRADGLADDLAKAQARIKEFGAKSDESGK